MKIKQTLLISLLGGALLLTGCSANNSEASENVEEEKIVPVQVETAQEGIISQQASLTGELAPAEVVQVSPKISGKISSINVSLGQKVNQGDVLFRIDTTDLENTVKQAQAAYNLAQANLKQAISSSDQGIVGAINSVAQAEQAFKDAEVNAKRIRTLFQSGAVSQAELDQVETALLNAKIAYDNAKQSLQVAEQKNAVSVGEASVEQARVSLESAKTQLAEAVVKAPISGIISVVPGTTGQLVSAQVPVVSIAKIDPLVVKVNLSEKEITTVKVGTKAYIEVPAIGKSIEAKVTAVSPVMNDALKAYPVEISIPNGKQELMADMVVNVQFESEISAAGEKLIIIPRSALVEEEGKRYVFKAEGDAAVKTEITIGKTTSKQVEVLEGIAQGEQIIVAGHTMITEGTKIKIQ